MSFKRKDILYEGKRMTIINLNKKEKTIIQNVFKAK